MVLDGEAMIHFRLARHISDCHGGGYYEDLKLEDDFFDGFEFQICRVKDIDGHMVHGGARRDFDLDPWQKRGNKNHVLHFAGMYQNRFGHESYTRCVTWDEYYFLFVCSEGEWEKIYRACQKYGVHREWTLKTFYDGISYYRVILEWKGDCD